MLRFLLDHHISPDVIQAALRLQSAIFVEHVTEHQWEALPDPELLLLAHREDLTLVTYDQASMPGFLRHFAELRQDHSGVIFIDTLTIRPSDIGGLARALARLWSREKDAIWLNRTYYLRRG
jgi:predicted nuclease of predicted toxin-antitoxin system